MSGMNAPASTVAIASALLVSNDAVTIKRLRQSLQQLALSLELCAEVPAAMALLNQRKFEAVVVDLQLGSDAAAVLERVRRSPSNRTAVMFAVSDSDAETAGADRRRIIAQAFVCGSTVRVSLPVPMDSGQRMLRPRSGQRINCPAARHRVVSIADRSGTPSRSRDRGLCPPRPC